MKRIISLFLLLILLAGCKEASLEEVEKETKIEVESPVEETRSVYESNHPPGSIWFGEIPASLMSYCWNEQLDECPSLEQYSKHDAEEQLVGPGKFTLSPGEKLVYTAHKDPTKPSIPIPDGFRVFLMDGEESIPVPVTENSFLAPQEEGNYTYICETTYEADVKGIAFYVFDFKVRN